MFNDGVDVYDTFFEISRKTFTTNHYKYSLTIHYNDIVSIYRSHIPLRDKNNQRNFLVPFGDSREYIEVTIVGGKQFLFAVENQEDFINEVTKRMNNEK